MNKNNNQLISFTVLISTLPSLVGIGSARVCLVLTMALWFGLLMIGGESARAASIEELSQAEALSSAEALPSPAAVVSSEQIDVHILEGQRLMSLGAHDSSLQEFLQAQHKIHRLDGVYSPMQVEVLALLAQNYLLLGDFQSANKQVELRYEIISRTASPVEHTAALYMLGDWYFRSLQLDQAQQTFDKALAIALESELPAPEVADFLLAGARVSYLKGECCDLDELLELQSESPLVAEVQLMAAGDLAILGGNERLANRLYDEVSDNAPGLPLGIARVDRMVDSYLNAGLLKTEQYRKNTTRMEMPPGKLSGYPLEVCESRLLDIVGGDEYKDYKIDLLIEVNHKGQAKKIRIAESNAPAKVNVFMQRLAGLYRYRPAKDQEKSARKKVLLRQRFDEPQAPVELSTAALGVFKGCHQLAGILERRSPRQIADVM